MVTVQSARSVTNPYRSNISVACRLLCTKISSTLRYSKLLYLQIIFRTVPSHDFWQFGIIIFVCLTGCLPWQKAAPDDPRYVRYLVWQSSNLVIPIKRTPKLFKLLTNRACKLFRKFLEPNPDRRPKNLNDLQKFLDDRWLAKNAEKDMIGKCLHK